jgi:hypothetical protein
MSSQTDLNNSKAKLLRPFPAAAALIYWLLSFWLEKRILEVPPSANLFNYICCKAVLLFALYAFWSFSEAVFRPIDARKRARWTFIYAVPYLAFLVFWLFKYHPFVLKSDELNIFLDAVRLESYAYWFNYFTGFYWISCLMAVPTAMGPVFVKLLIQALVCGYCCARERERGRWYTALPFYLLFCLPFVMDQGISAHRLPTYGMVYAAVFAKLLYDHEELSSVEKKGRFGGNDAPRSGNAAPGAFGALPLKDLLLLSAGFSILAIWRSEGIYFVPLGLILLLCAYKIKDKKAALRTAGVYLLVLCLAAVPQIKSYFFEENPSVALRTKPFMAYAVTIMMRNGLTEEMIGEEAAEMAPFVPVETIKKANEQYGESIYNGAFVLRHAEKADYPDQERFCDAVKRLIIKYPLLYLRSQLTAYMHVDRNTPYREGMSLWERVTAFSWHVNPAAILSLVFTLIFLFRRRWLPFWLGLGSLGNLALVVALMPATFPKYFYLTYLYAYLVTAVLLCRLLRLLGGAKAELSEKEAAA